MNDTAPHSSHAGRWIIAVVVTVVLYVVSAEPVTMSFWRRGHSDEVQNAGVKL